MSLNPHCGEDGLLGDEEISEIIPAIRKLSENGLDVIGPLTPEAAFLKAMAGNLDGIVAMYHDQGIAPLKIVTGIDSVNVSLGLPFVRTSVSHGTAVNIAGKGIADETSMVMALDLAVRLTQAR
jgi:4-hydroxythreonine-4-phosphate dehydrogenase